MGAQRCNPWGLGELAAAGGPGTLRGGGDMDELSGGIKEFTTWVKSLGVQSGLCIPFWDPRMQR